MLRLPFTYSYSVHQRGLGPRLGRYYHTPVASYHVCVHNPLGIAGRVALTKNEGFAGTEGILV